jgi:hypothetical protein
VGSWGGVFWDSLLVCGERGEERMKKMGSCRRRRRIKIRNKRMQTEM